LGAGEPAERILFESTIPDLDNASVGICFSGVPSGILMDFFVLRGKL